MARGGHPGASLTGGLPGRLARVFPVLPLGSDWENTRVLQKGGARYDDAGAAVRRSSAGLGRDLALIDRPGQAGAGPAARGGDRAERRGAGISRAQSLGPGSQGRPLMTAFNRDIGELKGAAHIHTHTSN